MTRNDTHLQTFLSLSLTPLPSILSPPPPHTYLSIPSCPSTHKRLSSSHISLFTPAFPHSQTLHPNLLTPFHATAKAQTTPKPPQSIHPPRLKRPFPFYRYTFLHFTIFKEICRLNCRKKPIDLPPTRQNFPPTEKTKVYKRPTSLSSPHALSNRPFKNMEQTRPNKPHPPC